jgi:hypothetical protein
VLTSGVVIWCCLWCVPSGLSSGVGVRDYTLSNIIYLLKTLFTSNASGIFSLDFLIVITFPVCFDITFPVSISSLDSQHSF